MRLNNIEAKFKMSIPYDRPDLNGNVYSKDSIISAFSKSVEGLPLTDIHGSNIIGTLIDAKIIGTTNTTVEVELRSKINYGGSYELVDFFDNKICSYQITSFGIGNE